jgi:hypothetical protein
MNFHGAISYTTLVHAVVEIEIEGDDAEMPSAFPHRLGTPLLAMSRGG